MLWHKISDNMGIPVFVLKDTMPYSEYRERGAYYAIQEQNYSQTDINIARLSMDYRNVNYKEKISIIFKICHCF